MLRIGLLVLLLSLLVAQVAVDDVSPGVAGAEPPPPPIERGESGAEGEPSAAELPPATLGAPSVTPPSGANIAVIRIEGMIYDFTLESLRRRVDRAMDAGASIIVIELDTPGGEVVAALRVSRYIKTIPVPTVAWINNEAYSAGIIIAGATGEIVMSPASATGDSAPITMGGEMSPTERAKVLSPILEEFRDSAARNGYPYELFHAMTVLGVELYLIEHRQTGERRVVNQADYAVMVGGRDPNDFLFDPTAATTAGAGGVQQVGAVTLRQARDADREQWRMVQRIHDGATLLTVSQDRAIEIGLATAIIANDRELAQHLGGGTVIRIPQSWSENLAGYLTHPIVRAVLVMVVLVGAYMEFQSPGVGIAGIAAATALVVLLGAPFLVGLSEVWHVLVFLLGLALLIVELVWFPGFGLVGIAGLVMMFVGLVLGIVPTGGGPSFGPINLPPREMWGRVAMSSFYMMIALVLSGIAAIWLTRYFHRMPLFNRLVLMDSQASFAGPGGMTPVHVSGDEDLGSGGVKIGQAGQVVVELRPTGRALIEGRVVDVVSPGAWVERGRSVKVVEVSGNRIVVEPD
jgi:membrane-bound serine protease (ClpP class)